MTQYGNIWQKRWFIPVWLIQWAIALLYLVISCIRLQDLDYARRNDYKIPHEAARAGWSAYIIIVTLCTVLANVAECYLFARRALSPFLVVALGAARFLLWVVILGGVAGAASGFWAVDFVSILIIVVFLLAVAVQLVFGAINMHKLRKGALVTTAGINNNTLRPSGAEV